jgi:type IV secretory pathway TrbD component
LRALSPLAVAVLMALMGGQVGLVVAAGTAAAVLAMCLALLHHKEIMVEILLLTHCILAVGAVAQGALEEVGQVR